MVHSSILETPPPPVGQSGLFACTETGHGLGVRGLTGGCDVQQLVHARGVLQTVSGFWVGGALDPATVEGQPPPPDWRTAVSWHGGTVGLSLPTSPVSSVLAWLLGWRCLFGV